MTTDLALGAACGALATLAMSGLMLVAQRAGLMGVPPPKRVVERAASAAGVTAPEPVEGMAAGVAHLAFGAAGGIGFAMLARPLRWLPPESVGVTWAMLIWATSYFGWIPALGILPPPPSDRPGRAWSMLAAHLLYGLGLGTAWRLARR